MPKPADPAPPAPRHVRHGLSGWRRALAIALAAQSMILIGAGAPATAEPGTAVRNAASVDAQAIPPQPLPEWPAALRAAVSKSTAIQSFTDSAGRTLKYIVTLPAGANGAQPQGVMIYFHGNNSGTQEEILNAFFPGIQVYAHQRGLVAVAVASPETRPPPQETIRQWYDEDWLTVSEFVDQRLPTHVNVDTQRLYFMGGSQGTCFLNDFLQVHGADYGGGFFGGCGCYNRMDATFQPDPDMLAGMRVYISTSTEDFLHESGWRGYGYWKYTLGFDTRGDLDPPGAHCSTHWSALETALDWFTDRSVIPEEPFRPHFRRLSTTPTTGLAVTQDGRLWTIARRPGGPGEPAQVHELWRSDDHGTSWSVIHVFDGVARSLVSAGNTLVLLLNDRPIRTVDGGQQFSNLDHPFSVWSLFANGHGGIGLIDIFDNVFTSANGGSTWTPVSDTSQRLDMANEDSVQGIAPPRMLIRNYQTQEWFSAAWPGGPLAALPITAQGWPRSGAWDGQRVLGLVRSATSSNHLFSNAGPGASWTELALPAAAQSYFQLNVAALPGPTSMVFGAMAWISDDLGGSWQRVPGLETGHGGQVVSDGQRVWYSNRNGNGPAFLLDTGEGVDDLRIFCSGFESAANC